MNRRWIEKLVDWLLGERRDWGMAMMAELQHIEDARARWEFGRECFWAVIRMSMSRPSLKGWIGLALLVPGVVLFGVAWSEVEPWNRVLREWTTVGGGAHLSGFGKLLLAGSIVLLPLLSLGMNLHAAVRGGVAGLSRVQYVALALAGGLLLFLVTGFVVDQAPCWASVPNCD